MKAAYITKDHKIEYGDFPKPILREGEALIKVNACALNHLDIHLAIGKLDIPLPHISGSDVSGTIEEINGDSELKVGQEVIINPAIPCGKCRFCQKGLPCEIVIIFGYRTLGGFAEYVAVPVGQLYPKPEKLSFVEAAAIPLTFLTAYHMLVTRANLQRSETVFVWGASGGLGSVAIQIAKNIGAKIIAAAKTEEDAKIIKNMGADHVIIYSNLNVKDEVERLTNGEKIDVVFETVGAKTWNVSLSILRPHGRVVVAGTTSGELTSQDLSDIYYFQQTILGSRMGTKEDFEQVLKLVNQGKLKPVLDKVFQLKDFEQAIKRLQESKHIGKIVLEVCGREDSNLRRH